MGYLMAGSLLVLQQIKQNVFVNNNYEVQLEEEVPTCVYQDTSLI